MPTEEQNLARERYLELCRIASIGGRLQPSLIMEAGEAAGFPMEIELRSVGEKSWPINTLLADAIYNSRIRFALSENDSSVYLDGTEFVVGPWRDALEAIEKWKKIVQPNWITWVKSDERPSAKERLDRLIAEIPTAYVFDPVELRFLVSEVGWSTEALRVMPVGIPRADQKDTQLPIDAFDILAQCERGAKTLSGCTIELDCPQEGTRYRFAEEGFIRIVEALTKRAANLKIPW